MNFTKNLFLIVSISSLLLLLHTTNANTILVPNPYKALEEEILVAKTQALKTASVIEGLLANPSCSKELKKSLSICQNQYGRILDSINEAIPLVEKKDAIEARFKFAAIFSYRSSCEQAFKAGLLPQPDNIAKEAAALKLVAGNVLDIVKGIEQNGFE